MRICCRAVSKEVQSLVLFVSQEGLNIKDNSRSWVGNYSRNVKEPCTPVGTISPAIYTTIARRHVLDHVSKHLPRHVPSLVISYIMPL